uniref:(northern house mosquito) hypothetical protein n=1 Tax=Culex pipiens TaxID=7175 RepID=A0A8D8J6Z4_CULPI
MCSRLSWAVARRYEIRRVFRSSSSMVSGCWCCCFWRRTTWLESVELRTAWRYEFSRTGRCRSSEHDPGASLADVGSECCWSSLLAVEAAYSDAIGSLEPLDSTDSERTRNGVRRDSESELTERGFSSVDLLQPVLSAFSSNSFRRTATFGTTCFGFIRLNSLLYNSARSTPSGDSGLPDSNSLAFSETTCMLAGDRGSADCDPLSCWFCWMSSSEGGADLGSPFVPAKNCSRMADIAELCCSRAAARLAACVCVPEDIFVGRSKESC